MKDWLKTLPLLLIMVLFNGSLGAMVIWAVIEDFKADKVVWAIIDILIFPLGVLRGIAFFFGII